MLFVSVTLTTTHAHVKMVILVQEPIVQVRENVNLHVVMLGFHRLFCYNLKQRMLYRLRDRALLI